MKEIETVEQVYDRIAPRMSKAWGKKDVAMMVAKVYAAQFQPQWIKINSESDLPDHTNDVIALVANEPIQAYCINGKWVGSHDVRSSVEDGWGGNFELSGQSTVTHWMPLPQPPKKIRL